MQDYAAKQAARDSVAKALQAASPKLVAVGKDWGKNDSLNAAAKNIRIELKAAFPGVKFSVKSSRFSMGDSIDVSWIDGPNAAQVDAIIDRYQAGSFNGMEDLYEYSRDAWKDAFGDAKYVHSRRGLSDKTMEAAIRTVKAQYAGNLSARGLEGINVADYRAGKYRDLDIMGCGSVYWALDSIIYRAAAKRSWAINKSAKQYEVVEA